MFVIRQWALEEPNETLARASCLAGPDAASPSLDAYLRQSTE